MDQIDSTTVISEGEIEESLDRLTAELRTLERITSSGEILFPAIGLASSLAVGPLAFVGGAALGAVTAVGFRYYATHRQKQLQDRISTLEQKRLIAPAEADDLRARVEGLHTDSVSRPTHGESTPTPTG